jgi:drug/metabolite transporter (DMT)-like permease
MTEDSARVADAPSSLRRRRLAGIGFIIASALAFGSMAILARFVYADGVDTVTLLALRFAIAAACLAVITRLRGLRLPRGATLAAAALLGGAGYAGQAASFFTALTFAPAGLVALLLYLHPALVALLAALLLREPIGPTKLLALGVALAGTALTVIPALVTGAAGAFPRIGVGVALGVAAAAIYAVYIVAGTRLARSVEPLALSTVVVASAAVVFVAAAALSGVHLPQSAKGWSALAGIAIIGTVAAISLFFAGLDRVGPTSASTLSTVEPVFTVALAAIVLGETIAPVQLAGGALILAAVVLLARAPPGKPAPDPGRRDAKSAR